jgi:mannitol-specific phosphotransferase system IIBC component
MGYLAILLCAVASMIIGSLWYGPLFGKTWMKLQGFTKQDIEKGKKMNMAPYYLVAFVASLITAYILEWLMNALKVSSIKGALLLVFLIWLGFYATTLSGSIIWEGKPAKLYILNVSYWLVSLLVSSAILFYL